MTKIADIAAFLDRFAPTALAESWDNVGLLIGDPERAVRRVMACLTVTPEVADEAVQRQVDLIVSHHPCPFQAVRRITPETPVGRILLKLIGAGIGVYSPHTGYDSAAGGINRQIADRLGLLTDIRPILPSDDDPTVGTGRIGTIEEHILPFTLHDLGNRVQEVFDYCPIQMVGDPGREITSVAIACGAAGSMIDDVLRAGADAMIVGEVKLHEALSAANEGLSLIVPGHHASEFFAVEQLAEQLGKQFPAVGVVVSREDCDPFQTV